VAFHTFFNHNFGWLHSQSCQCHCAPLRLECLIKVGDEYLEMEQRYKLVTKGYLGKGKDGYDSLAKAEVMVDEEIAPNLTSAVQNHFQAIKMKQGKAGRKASIHHQSLVTLSRKTSVVKQLESDGLLPPNRFLYNLITRE